MNEKKFDEWIQVTLRDAEMEAPSEAWKNISTRLNMADFELENEQRTSSSPFAWKKYAVAASVLLLAVSSIILTLKNETNVAKIETKIEAAPTKSNTESLANLEQKSEVETLPTKHTIFRTPKLKSVPTMANELITQKCVEDAIESNPVIENEKKSLVESEPVFSDEKNVVETRNIPVYSLKVGSTPAVQDEITVIEDQNLKKEKKNKNENKVIFVDKKYNKAPKIDYRLPWRF